MKHIADLGRKHFLLDENINQFFNSIPIPSYVWQKTKNDFILIDYNNAALKVTNGKIKDLLHEKASVIHEDRPDIIEAINKCFREKKSISEKFEYLMKTTGEKVFISLKIYHLPPDLIIVHIKDVTQWKLAEEKLKNSEEKYKLLFEKAPIPIAITDFKGVIIDCNKACEQQFGYIKKEILRKNYLDLGIYSPDLIPKLKERISQLTQGEAIKPVELELTKKDGTKSWITNQMSLVNVGGEILIQSFIMDITERRNFEKKIQRKLENETFISTISSSLIRTVDIDRAVNKSLLEMGVYIGATRAYILLFNEGDSLEFYIQEWCVEGVDPQLINLTTISKNRFPWIFDIGSLNEMILVRNLSEIPKEATKTREELIKLNIKSLLAFPITINKESYGYIGFDNITNISEWEEDDFDIFKTTSEIIGNALERKWSEETLKGSHQLLAGVISSITEVIYLVDNNFNVVWANNVAKQMFGLRIIEQKCYRVFSHRGKPCRECLAVETFEDGKIHEKEKILTNIDGKKKTYWSTSSVAGFNIEGERELAVLILRDISENKKMEKSLNESENNLMLLNKNLMEKVEERTKELKMSEEIYKKILNDLDVGFYKGEFKGKLLMHNSAFNTLLGLDASKSLIGFQSSQFFNDLNVQERYFNELLENGYITNFKAQIKNPKGENIVVYLNSHLIRDHEGNPKEVEGIMVKIIKEA
ncbi:MAG: PAS domain S-box protein [Candidatus Lokiarchaeota archaeon]|nr:PAS domain S-box protein [Candidatus Lokiarchaeota archaeon]